MAIEQDEDKFYHPNNSPFDEVISAEKLFRILIGLDKEETILPFILRIPPGKLTSQAFWEHMEYLSEETIERIEKELSSQNTRNVAYGKLKDGEGKKRCC